jgi:hypothetical protein
MRLQLVKPAATLRQVLERRAAAAQAATRAAANDAARVASSALYADMRAGFDRPTPYTIPPGEDERRGAVRVEFAGRSTPAAAVMIRGPGQVPGGAIPQQSYLRAQILGGRRRFKRLELALQRKGLMPAGWYAIPAGAAAGRNGGGGGARFDAYGNMSRGQVVQLLSYFEAFTGDRSRANSTPATRARLAKDKSTRSTAPARYVPGVGFVTDKAAAKLQPRRIVGGVVYFAVKGPASSGGLRPGIWERRRLSETAQGVRPVLFFVPAVNYRPRIEFADLLRRVVPKSFGASLARRRVLPGAAAGG